MQVIGYVRVSTEDQAREGVSLAAQREKLEAYASLYNLTLVEIVGDEGVSAKTLKRPGLQAALEALKDTRAQGLLIAKLDRLTRSIGDWDTLVKSYFQNGFALFSVQDQIDTSRASGRLVLNVLMTVAQWEREAIGERTKDALAHKKAKGERLGAPALGVRIVDGAPVEETDGVETLRYIVHLRRTGHTLKQIACRLNAEGYRTKRGGSWYPSTVKYLLENVAPKVLEAGA